DRIRKGHFSKAVMVPIALAVGGNMHQLGLLAIVPETGIEPGRKRLAAVQQPLKRDGPGTRPVVKKDRDLPAFSQANEVRVSGVHAGIGRLQPGRSALRKYPIRSLRRTVGERADARALVGST